MQLTLALSLLGSGQCLLNYKFHDVTVTKSPSARCHGMKECQNLSWHCGCAKTSRAGRLRADSDGRAPPSHSDSLVH